MHAQSLQVPAPHEVLCEADMQELADMELEACMYQSLDLATMCACMSSELLYILSIIYIYEIRRLRLQRTLMSPRSPMMTAVVSKLIGLFRVYVYICIC